MLIFKNPFFVALMLSACLISENFELSLSKTIENDKILQLEQQINNLEEKIKSQRAELKTLKDNITGALDSDARLIIYALSGDQNCHLTNVAYALDGTPISENSRKTRTIFDSFVNEGQHVISLKAYCGGNNKIFTYVNSEISKILEAKISITAKQGGTSYVELRVNKDRILEDTKVVAHHIRGRTVLPLSDIPHLLPGSVAKNPKMAIVISKDLVAKSKIEGLEVCLSEQHLPSLPMQVEVKKGILVFDGTAVAGRHELKIILRLQNRDGSLTLIPLSTSLDVQPSQKTEVLFSKHRKAVIQYGALP
ncbi:MAG: hypothetical protein I8H75_02380 [Myxococcaceae bacterium]|nr:hypothetical protein [Myxococcaceae bacterium]MBH2006182.1 hypothetical protein [Myxococcaceae bacterium]